MTFLFIIFTILTVIIRRSKSPLNLLLHTMQYRLESFGQTDTPFNRKNPTISVRITLYLLYTQLYLIGEGNLAASKCEPSSEGLKTPSMLLCA